MKAARKVKAAPTFDLPFETWGRQGAPRLLLLHGFTGNRSSWRHLEPLIGDALQAVAVDLPGHGEAPLPGASGPEGFEATLAALERVVDHAGGGPIAVRGYSQGARLALGLALRAPGKVGRLILESVNPGLPEAKERRARERDDEALASKVLRGGVERFLKTWEALPMFEGLRALPSDAREALHARRAAREMPMAWRRAFDGCHHAPHLEAPAAYAAEVRAFLDVPWSEAERGERVKELGR